MDIKQQLFLFLKKKWFDGVIFVGASTVTTIHLFANTLFVENVAKLLSMHENTVPVKPHPRILHLLKTVLKDLQCREADAYTPFTFIGLDPMKLGAQYFKTGVHIGIPRTYAYSTPDECNVSRICINNEYVDWSRPRARAVLDAIMLPEEAKKFAIAHEVLAAQSADFVRENLSYPFLFLSPYLLYNYACYPKLNLVKKSAMLRSSIFGGCVLICTSLWLLQDNIFAYMKEKKIMKKLSQLGPEYVKGGFEYYDKLLQRNIAVRELVDDKMNHVFSERGEQKSYRYIFKTLRISDRRNFFATKLREITQNSETPMLS